VEPHDAGCAHRCQVGNDQSFVRRQHDQLIAGLLVPEIVLHRYQPLTCAAGPRSDLGERVGIERPGADGERAAVVTIRASVEFGATSEVRTFVLLPAIEIARPPESGAVKDRAKNRP
jgi:hypothetical protein